MENLNEITNIETPCNACKESAEKPCEYCIYWQFAQLGYFLMKTNPMNSLANIINGVNSQNN